MTAVVPHPAADSFQLPLPSEVEQPFPLKGSGVPEAAEISKGCRIWRMGPPAAMSPRSLGFIFAMLGSISLLVAGAFWAAGAPLVMPFAGLEVVALGFAFLTHSRQMDRNEELRLDGKDLVVRRFVRGEVLETRFSASATRLRCQGLIDVVGPVEVVRVGRRLPLALRQTTCRSLNLVLHAC
jgi:uncharacterized membrane protein